jgi:cytochrome b561
LTTNRYSLLQRLLHWLIAILVFGLLIAGAAFWALDFDGLVSLVGEETTKTLFMVHKSVGITVLLLTILRILLRRRSPAPPYDPPLGGLERMVGTGLQWLLNLLLIGLPIGGWIATAASGYPVQFFGITLPGLIGENKELGEMLFGYHGIGGLVLAFLVLIHVAAGLKHWRLKDGVMTRISLP